MKESNKTKKPLTFRTLTKKNVWDIQENDILRMWESAEKDVEIKENILHYLNIIRTAFVVEELKDDNTLLKSKYEKLGYKVAQMNITESSKLMWAIKKRSISRVSDRDDKGGRGRLRCIFSRTARGCNSLQYPS